MLKYLQFNCWSMCMGKQNLRVVVADDEETNLYILVRNMNDGGYETKGFENGSTVWQYLQENPDKVDVVILDKMMYDLNGLEIISMMKAHPILKDIPIILQSGDTDVEEGLAAGADRYFMKPFKGSDLIDVVRELAIPLANSNNAVSFS